VVFHTVEQRLKWTDPRWTGINGTACRKVISKALKVPTTVYSGWLQYEPITQAQVESAYFLPRLSPTNANPGTDAIHSRTMQYDESDYKVTMITKTSPTFSQGDVPGQSDTPYYGFPFDQHTIYANFRAEKPATKVNGCSGEWSLSSAGTNAVALSPAGIGFLDTTQLSGYSVEAMATLLPASGDWLFSEKAPQVKLEQLDGAAETCSIRINIRRNPTVYLLKAFIPDMIIVTIGMLSLFINPAIPPLFGGRCSILIIAMLITMNSSLNRNNGLGRLSYVLKVDINALGNLGLLLIAMACSVIVHQMFRYEYTRLGVALDRAVRVTMSCIIFPGVQVFEFLFLASESPVGPAVFLIVYLITAITIVSLIFRRRVRAQSRKLKKCVEQLQNLDLSDPNASDVLRNAFVLFDADGSGSLDAKEGRKLLKYVNPNLSRELAAAAIREADRTGNGIAEDDFHLMMERWSVKAGTAEIVVKSPADASISA